MESMASLEPIVKSNNAWRRCCSSLKTRYSHTLVTSKVGILCLVWLACLNFVDQTLWTPWVLLSQDYTKYIVLSRVTSCLLYPLFAYLGEKWTRYYVLMTGMFMVCSASFVMLFLSTCFEALTIFLSSHPNSINILIINSSVYFIGSSLFYSNIVQFSVAQIPRDQFSREIASFCRWLVYINCCSAYLSQFLFDEGFLILLINNKQWYSALSACLLTSLMGVVISRFVKRGHFIIESPQTTDSLKLICKVIRFAYRNSATKLIDSNNNNSKKGTNHKSTKTSTTESSQLKMLDYGMKPYGGEFTVDQVESVRSFLNVLLILITFQLLIGSFHFLHFDGIYYLTCYTSLSFNVPLVLYSLIYIMVTALPIPIVQLVFLPLLPGSMALIRRIWSLLAFIAIGAPLFRLPMYFMQSFHRAFCVLLFWSNDIMAIVLGTVLSFTVLEYIITHTPQPMLGLLIGIWSINFLNIAKDLMLFFPLSSTAHIILSLLPSLVFVFHIFATYRYRYQHDNLIPPEDHNSTTTKADQQSLKTSVGEILVEKIIHLMLKVTGVHRYFSNSFYFFQVRPRASESPGRFENKSPITLKQPN